MDNHLAVIYGDDFLRYDFGADHPLNQLRVKLAVQLMESVGLIRSPHVFLASPPPATIGDVLLFHHASYLDFVSGACASGSGWLDECHDTPAFPGGLEASLVVVGGAIRGLELVLDGTVEHAFHLGGGLHHAFPDRAAGFCILNDVAVCIATLKRRGFRRIMYLDFDAHQGDGVMYGFYDDPGVLAVDFHEDGKFLFPGRGHIGELGEGAGHRHKVNVPFPPHSGDNSYLFAFHELVPALARAYRPEIILMQCGVDTHCGDPLTHMCLTFDTYAQLARQVHDLAHELCDGRLVMFGGGGYSPASVAIGWTRMAAGILGIELPASVPEDWRQEFARLTQQEGPRAFRERPVEDHMFREMWEQVDWLKRKLGLP